MKFQTRWTDEMHETLNRLIAEGKPYEEVAEEMGLAVGSVRAKCAYLRIFPKKENRWPKERCETLRKLLEEGKTYDDVAKAMTLHRSTVEYRARLLGFTSVKQLNTWTPDEDWRLQLLVNEGRTTSEIAQLTGRTKNAVISRIDRLNLRQKEEPHSTTVLWSGTRTRSFVPLGPLPKICQWIEGEPTWDDTCKCCAPTQAGSVYCSEHLARAYTKKAEPEERYAQKPSRIMSAIFLEIA
jgi:hypothetical protein